VARRPPAGRCAAAVPPEWAVLGAIFTAEATLNREYWGLTWNMPLGGGSQLVSKEIRIEIDAEAVLQPRRCEPNYAAHVRDYWQANGGVTYQDADGREVVFASWTSRPPPVIPR
jgi:hypothetical protein